MAPRHLARRWWAVVSLHDQHRSAPHTDCTPPTRLYTCERSCSKFKCLPGLLLAGNL